MAKLVRLEGTDGRVWWIDPEKVILLSMDMPPWGGEDVPALRLQEVDFTIYLHAKVSNIDEIANRLNIYRKP